MHLERARAPSREPVVGAVNRALGELARLLAERARLAARRLNNRAITRERLTTSAS